MKLKEISYNDKFCGTDRGQSAEGTKNLEIQTRTLTYGTSKS